MYRWSDQLLTIKASGSSSYPLTTGLSTYWYGPYHYASTDGWTQGTSSADDSGFAKLGRNISFPDSPLNNISFVFRSGLHYDVGQRTITLTAYLQFVPVSGTFIVSLSISDPLSTQILDVFVVSDWDVSGINLVGSEVNACHHDLPVDLGSSPVSLGPNGVMSSAVNDFGFISQNCSLSVTVIAAATDTSSRLSLETTSLVLRRVLRLIQRHLRLLVPLC
jgi:hypothetical protein